MSIGKRIKQIRSEKKISQVELSRLAEATQAAVSRYENDQQYPGGEFLSRLVNAMNVNLNWLLTGTGSMFQELQEVDASFLGDTISIPIVGEIAAGHPAEIIYEEPYHQLDIPVGLLSFPPPYVVFRVSGDSMAPQVMPGDLVICSEDWRNVDTNGKIMAFRTDDGITLKKLMDDIKHKTTLLIPLNSRYAPVIYVEDDPDIVMIGILDLCIRRYNREL